jgi:hypothetical protein
VEPAALTTDCSRASMYAPTAATSRRDLTRKARPNAFRRTARSRHSGVGCSQAPRPGSRSRGSATTLATCPPGLLRSTTTRKSADRTSRRRQPTHVRAMRWVGR